VRQHQALEPLERVGVKAVRLVTNHPAAAIFQERSQLRFKNFAKLLTTAKKPMYTARLR
jgi:hypothetical protein